MPVLAIDTSAAVSVALVSEAGRRLSVNSSDERRRHAESLAPLITRALEDAGVDRLALTAVVAGTGPAPFTGLRVGLVTARTLALALGIPVLGVPSIDALAVQAVSDLGLTTNDEVVVATDARRKEVYWGRYRVLAHESSHGLPRIEPLAGPEVARPATLAEALTAHPATAVVGEGAARYPDHLPLDDDAPLLPDATVLARLALARREAGDDLPTEPLYLRRPDVHEPGARRAG